MKNNSETNALILAQQLIEENESAPEKVVAKLLREMAEMREKLDQLQKVVQVEPATHSQHRRMLLQQAITIASLRMHKVFHQCRVPNAILTKVGFPDGLYELTFRRLESKNQNQLN